MWIKINLDEQAAKEAKSAKKKLASAAIFSITLGAVLTIVFTFTYPRLASIQNGGAFLVPKDEILAHLASALFIGILIGTGTFLLCVYTKKTTKKTLVCPQCDKVKSDDGVYSCICGGHFENIFSMKWIEEQRY